ncbi:SdiA-regulated domain-containing protein [bacterium]|nr:SdiA-regulated domain-containing protein [bacterium]
MRWFLAILPLLLACFFAPNAARSAADDGPRTAPPDIADAANLTQWEFEYYWPLESVPEPSGLCYCPPRSSLFLVDDGAYPTRPGAVFELDLSAQIINSRELGTDLEGICYCPLDGYLYVVNEYEEHVYILDPATLETIGEFQVSRFYQGKEVLQAGGNGFEGIEFIPSIAGAEPYLLLLNQDDPHALVKVLLADAKPSDAPVPISDLWSLAEINLGELHYDSPAGELWVIHSWMNVIEVLDIATMDVLRWEVFPGAAQEAVTVDGDGLLWIGYDLGGISRYRRRVNE